MDRKFILSIILIVSTSLIGCGNNYSKANTQDNGSTNKVVGDTNKSNEDVKNTVENVKDNIEAAGDYLKYTAKNLKDDILNSGYTPKESINTEKEYFKGNETDYLIGNDIVRIYEYDSTNELKSDIKTISADGLTINGISTNYPEKPYYFTKGNSLVVYEGNEPAYIDEFKRIYGNTIIP